MKIGICTTGGYYYRWAGGDKFYNWLYQFCKSNKDFIPNIVSWQPEKNVPKTVKNQFKENILYRDNNGCDWGCYNFFVNWLQDNNMKNYYDYIVFCHDDILSNHPDWPKVLVNYAQLNKNFDLVSFGGAFHKLPDASHVDISKIENEYYKSFDSMCFCVRVSDKLFDLNPFVTIPGYDQDICGDSGCTIVMYNILNMWGSESIGICSVEGNSSDSRYIDYVSNFKRGRSNF